ncbi:metallopeptidase TldD-related protein, partial [Lysobacter sp. 2RAB21]
LGPPPAHTVERAQPSQRLPLPRLPDGEFERLLARRATCRNFDPARALPYDLFVRMLQRVFAAQAQVRIQDDTIFLKKHTPSGGGLHATEAYLIEDGKITAPVKGATLIGNGPETMQKVSMIGHDLALDEGVGVCGKDGQSVPVGVGQPSLLIDGLTVGGTSA